MSESEWWSSLTGDDIEINAHGFPPYDVEKVADFIEHFITDGPVLDIGCGPGRLGRTLARRRPDVLFCGFDVAPNMIEIAAKDLDGNWLAMTNDGRNIPWDGVFQVAYSVTVFQHLPEDVVVGYVEQVHSKLTDDGVFLFTYATGDEDTFLSHQVSDEQAFGWLDSAGFRYTQRFATHDTYEGWNWAAGVK